MSSSESRRTAPVRIQASHEAVRIQIFDGSLQCVADAYHRLDTELPVGLYELQMRAGSVLRQRMISVRPGEGFAAGPGDLDMPLLSAVPLHGTASGTPLHIEAVSRVLARPAADGERGRLVLVLRNTLDRRRCAAGAPEPYSVADTIRHGMELWLTDGDGAILEHLGLDHFEIHDDGIATTSIPLPVDRAYRLRVIGTAQSGGPPLTTDQALWVEQGWQTAVFLPNTSAGAALDLTSVHLVGLAPYGPGRWDGTSEEAARVGIAVELALAGLRDGRASLPARLLPSLLEGKFDDPMLGILGAHTLLLRHEGERRERGTRNIDEQWDHLGGVLNALDRLLPSGSHPDLVALRVLAAVSSGGRLADTERTVTDPPMLRRGVTRLLAAESATGRSLLEPGGRAQLISCMLVDQGPWTTWLAPRPVPRMQAAAAAPEAFAAAEMMEALTAEMMDEAGAEPMAEAAPVVGMTQRIEMLQLKDATAQRVQRFLMEVAATDRSANVPELLDDAHSAWISMSTAQPIHAVRGALSSIRNALSEPA